MKIAIATFADLPNPPVKGGAVETLIDDLCKENEKEEKILIDIYSIYNTEAKEIANSYKFTSFNYYEKKKLKKISIKNIIYKLTKKSILDTNMRNLVENINHQKYDFVIVTSIIRELKYILKKIKSPTIWYLHGDPVSVLKKDEIEKILKECDGVITVSNFIKKRIEKFQNNCQILTVPNCTDLLLITKEKEKEVYNNFRNRFGIKKDEILVTYVGRINSIKGILELVEAFVEIDINNMKLLVVGSPKTEEEKEYYKKIKEKSNEKIIFSEYIEHNKLNELYYSTDVVAVPSICMEAAPLVIIEAMYLNKKIISTNIGGIPEYAYGKNVILVEVDDNLKDNLKKALIDCLVLEDISKKTIEEKYSTRAYYNNFYKALLKLKAGE